MTSPPEDWKNIVNDMQYDFFSNPSLKFNLSPDRQYLTGLTFNATNLFNISGAVISIDMTVKTKDLKGNYNTQGTTNYILESGGYYTIPYVYPIINTYFTQGFDTIEHYKVEVVGSIDNIQCFTNSLKKTYFIEYEYRRDVKLYSNLTLSALGQFDGTLKLNWYASEKDASAIKVDELKLNLQHMQELSKYYPVRSPWFSLTISANDVSENTMISHIFKSASNTIQIADKSSADRINIQTNDNSTNALHSLLYDSSGLIISHKSSNALYTHPSNITNINNTLQGALFSHTNSNLDSSNGALLTSIKNSSDQGQASTINGGLYYCLSDISGKQISTRKTVEKSGSDVNPLFISFDNSTELDSSALYVTYSNNITNDGQFMFSVSVDGSLTTMLTKQDFSGYAIMDLGIANETDQTVWLKVYDVSFAQTPVDAIENIKLNIPVPALDSREINMTRGLMFNKGIYFKLTNSYQYDASGNFKDIIYVTGSYRTLV